MSFQSSWFSMRWIWSAFKWWLFHGDPVRSSQILEVFPLNSFILIIWKPSFHTFLQLSLSTVYSSFAAGISFWIDFKADLPFYLVHGKFPYPYHAKQLKCWVSLCHPHSWLCMISPFISSSFTNNLEGHRLSIWGHRAIAVNLNTEILSCLLMWTPVSVSSSLGASLLEWEKQPLASLCEGRI